MKDTKQLRGKKMQATIRKAQGILVHHPGVLSALWSLSQPVSMKGRYRNLREA